MRPERGALAMRDTLDSPAGALVFQADEQRRASFAVTHLHGSSGTGRIARRAGETVVADVDRPEGPAPVPRSKTAAEPLPMFLGQIRISGVEEEARKGLHHRAARAWGRKTGERRPKGHEIAGTRRHLGEKAGTEAFRDAAPSLATIGAIGRQQSAGSDQVAKRIDPVRLASEQRGR